MRFTCLVVDVSTGDKQAPVGQEGMAAAEQVESGRIAGQRKGRIPRSLTGIPDPGLAVARCRRIETLARLPAPPEQHLAAGQNTRMDHDVLSIEFWRPFP